MRSRTGTVCEGRRRRSRRIGDWRPEDGDPAPHSLAQLRRWRHDPVAFAREVLGVDLWDRQRAIARALRSHGRVACRSCHAAGKTHLAATPVLWFLATNHEAVVLTTASTFRQVRYVLWRTIHALLRAARTPLGGRCATPRSGSATAGTAWG